MGDVQLPGSFPAGDVPFLVLGIQRFKGLGHSQRPSAQTDAPGFHTVETGQLPLLPGYCG